jgi:hypothetical protein
VTGLLADGQAAGGGDELGGLLGPMPAEYTCTYCQRNQHSRCREPLCTCCEGDGG